MSTRSFTIGFDPTAELPTISIPYDVLDDGEQMTATANADFAQYYDWISWGGIEIEGGTSYSSTSPSVTVGAASGSYGNGGLKVRTSNMCGYSSPYRQDAVWIGVPQGNPDLQLSPRVPKVGLGQQIESFAFSPGGRSYHWRLGGATIMNGQGTGEVMMRTSDNCGYDLTIRAKAINRVGETGYSMISVPFDCVPGLPQLAVYPNPANEYLIVGYNMFNFNKAFDATKLGDSNINDEVYQVEIFTPEYISVFKGELNGEPLQINTEDFENGIYYLHIRKGDKVSKQQIIIER